MKKPSLRLLLVDDHNLFRKALRAMVQTFHITSVVYEATNGREALELIAKHTIDVVLLDVQMPHVSGVEVLKQMRQDGLKTKVIMLTQHGDSALIAHVVQLGASGFLLKGCDPAELKTTILEVALKGFSFDERIQHAISTNFSANDPHHSLEISPREFQVLKLLKDGQSNKEVAQSLGLTLRTIESYRKKLIKKTGSRNTVDLVSLAYRTGILA